MANFPGHYFMPQHNIFWPQILKYARHNSNSIFKNTLRNDIFLNNDNAERIIFCRMAYIYSINLLISVLRDRSCSSIFGDLAVWLF